MWTIFLDFGIANVSIVPYFSLDNERIIL